MKIQKMAFPEGVEYDLVNRTYRTKRINTIILQIAQLARVSGDDKKENPCENAKDSALVAPSMPVIYLVVLGSTQGFHRASAWLPSLPKIQLNPTSQTA